MQTTLIEYGEVMAAAPLLDSATYAQNDGGEAPQNDRRGQVPQEDRAGSGVEAPGDYGRVVREGDAKWAEGAIWWHVYPLGFCGAPIRPTAQELAGLEPQPRLRQLIGWLDYAKELGVTGLLLGPIFASQSHGYDTLDHYRIDPRLGTEADFDDLVAACAARGLRLVLDGVFSHVGSTHPWLLSDLAGGEGSGDLFDIDWHAAGGPRPRVWEGHGGLARFNHNSEAAIGFVTGVMKYWLARGISGWRLDAAYSVPNSFWAAVLPAVRAEFPGAWFLGEVIHGDYARFVSDAGVNSVTQYELWKSVWSSLKDANLFELDWTLQRHSELLDTFVPQTFVGNHDVTRIASRVGYDNAIFAAAILFTVGGIPSIYAGDELGFLGVKEDRIGGDDAVRPAFPESVSQISDDIDYAIQNAYLDLVALRRERPWLATAKTSKIELTNKRYVYEVQAREGFDSLRVEIDLEKNHISIVENGNKVWEH